MRFNIFSEERNIDIAFNKAKNVVWRSNEKIDWKVIKEFELYALYYIVKILFQILKAIKFTP